MAAKKISLLDINPVKYYLCYANIYGLGNTLWPCKIKCTSTHGWQRGYTKISGDARFIHAEILGTNSEIRIPIIKTDAGWFVDQMTANKSDTYLSDRIEILQQSISKLSANLQALQNISLEDL